MQVIWCDSKRSHQSWCAKTNRSIVCGVHITCSQAVFPAYEVSLDNFLQLVKDKIFSANSIQLILLAAIGVAMSGVAIAVTLIGLHGVTRLRSQMYRIFLSMPASMIRRLADKKHILGDEEEGEAEEEAAGQTGPAGPDERLVSPETVHTLTHVCAC
jgi:hypothetical protein